MFHTFDSAGSLAAVTPHDTNDIFVNGETRWVWVGGAGNVSVVTHTGQTVAFTGVTAGTLLPIRVRRVRSTGTTATNMVAGQY